MILEVRGEERIYEKRKEFKGEAGRSRIWGRDEKAGYFSADD